MISGAENMTYECSYMAGVANKSVTNNVLNKKKKRSQFVWMTLITDD